MQWLARGPDAAVQELALSPEEYFVLSRIEHAVSVGEALVSSGLPADRAEEILNKLVGLGAVIVSEAPTPAPEAGPASPLRARAHDRRRRVLEAQLRGGNMARPTPLPTPPEPDPLAVSSPPLEVSDTEKLEIELVAADDPRLDPSLPVSIAEQRWILALSDGLETWSDFEVLGLSPTHDVKAIRRAFHVVSRRLHPDTYYGRDLGPYRELLGTLFRRARVAHGELQKSEVRTPHVDRCLAERASNQRQSERREAAKQALEDLRRQEQEAALLERRRRREAQQSDRQRQRVRARMHSEASEHLLAAAEAEREGKWAQAANLYRIALQADPEDASLRALWQRTRMAAQRDRAADAFQKALAFASTSQTEVAAALFLEAARANPTVEHLAHAADALSETDHVQAHDFAMAALDALGRGDGAGDDKSERANLRLMIARAFLAVGQQQTARQQALIAQELSPHDPQVRALLNSIKVT
jgi:tetratricopeptide (TPR) repeat protein